MTNHDLALLKKRLGTGPLSRYAQENNGLKQAAVLILLYRTAQGIHILLTRRSERMSSHAGQISFPGGRADPGETVPAVTALREAEEEIALPSHTVEIIGGLESRCSSSGFCVTPVIGYCDELPELTAFPHEVEEIIHLPLSFIVQEGMFHVGTKNKDGIKREFYFIDFKEYYIWGITAGLLRDLAVKLS